jgi:hypothetical protein
MERGVVPKAFERDETHEGGDKSRHYGDFLKASLVDGSRAARETEFVGAEFAERGSGAAFDGRGVDFDL